MHTFSQHLDVIYSGAPANDIFDAAKKAGGQLVKDGIISTENLKIIGRATEKNER